MGLSQQSIAYTACGLVSAIGTRDFSRSLIDEINSILPVSHITVFTFEPTGSVDYLVTDGAIKTDKAHELAKAYSRHFFRTDPNLHRIYRCKEALLPQWLQFPDQADVATSYYNYFFAETDLMDKISLIFSTGEIVFYCNFYRLACLPKFSDREKQNLKTLTPLVASCLERHKALTSNEQQSPAPLAKLTERETDVCELIVSGHSSQAIALNLGLSINSVKTYRKRAYSKLAISSQNELFHLMLQ